MNDCVWCGSDFEFEPDVISGALCRDCRDEAVDEAANAAEAAATEGLDLSEE